MQKIKIRLPAPLTNFGPAGHNLGLAAALYTTVEVTPREDDQLIIETDGAGAGDHAPGISHPVVLGMMRIFQQIEQAPPGLTVRIHNEIPIRSGLGTDAIHMTAGIIAASNLSNLGTKRADVIETSALLTGKPDQVAATMLGGLTAVTRSNQKILYRSLPVSSFQLILACPDPGNYQPVQIPENLPAKRVFANMQRVPLLIEALRQKDLDLLAAVLQDDLFDAFSESHIPGYQQVAEAARLAGALAVTTVGGGPALLIISRQHHDQIAAVTEAVYAKLQIPAQVRVVPVDTQGVVISMMQTQR